MFKTIHWYDYKIKKRNKNEFEKDFFKLINQTAFGKIKENVRNHRDIELVKADEKRSKLVSEPNYHTENNFPKNLLEVEMKKTKVKMNKSVYLGMSIIDISKMLTYEFRYDCIKSKHGDKAKLCCMNTYSFVIHIITKGFYKDIGNDVERWFHQSNYDENKTGKIPLLKGMNKKVTGSFKDELRGKIMAEFVGIRPKTYAI